MADSPTQRPSPARRGTEDQPRPWRVTPAPDGRGGRPQTPPPRGPSARWVVVLVVLALLGLNLYISSQALQPASRVAIPFSPTFISQVNNDNVSSISSTGNSVQGTFKAAFKYP